MNTAEAANTVAQRISADTRAAVARMLAAMDNGDIECPATNEAAEPTGGR